jgi:hypothetical protein
MADKPKCATCDGSGWIYDPCLDLGIKNRGWMPYRPCHDLACPVQGDPSRAEKKDTDEHLQHAD